MDPSGLRNLRARGIQLDTSTDSSTDTAVLQQAINDVNVCRQRLTVDGVYGPRTEEAVKEFQSKSMQKVDGIAGAQTLRALYEFLGKIIRTTLGK